MPSNVILCHRMFIKIHVFENLVPYEYTRSGEMSQMLDWPKLLPILVPIFVNIQKNTN